MATRRKYKANDNLTAGERSALKALIAREDVAIKPADKGSEVVVLEKADYLQEAERQLGNGWEVSLRLHLCSHILDFLSGQKQLKKGQWSEMFHQEQRRFHVATGGETLYEKKLFLLCLNFSRD